MQLIKDAVQRAHDDKHKLGMRFGQIYAGGDSHDSQGGCFHGFVNTLYNARIGGTPYVYAVFQGAGANLSFEAIKNGAQFNKEMLEHKQPWNHFQGDSRTLRWVEFLLSNHSPWRLLRPFILGEPEYINNAGFIFTNLKEIPAKLCYNFVMAMRYPWEMPAHFALFRELAQADIGESLALYISLNFLLKSEAKDINGPYELAYPWSCLEETGFESVGRFVLGRPADVRPGVNATDPNVHALWPIGNEGVTKHAKDVFASFEEAKTLKLSMIVAGLTECIHKQEKVM